MSIIVDSMYTLKYFFCLCLIIAPATVQDVDTSTQGVPTVTVSQRTITIPRGGRGTVECKPEGNPLPKVQWLKANGELLSGINPNGNTLIISDAREEDYGNYVCQGIVEGTVMTTAYSQVNSEDVDTSTQGVPTVTVSQRKITIPRGGRGTVECKPEGNPLPKVQWLKANGELLSGINPNGNTLIISDAREEDYGNYVCQGIVEGTVMTTDYSQVNSEANPATTPSIEVSAEQLKIAAGGSKSVTCTPGGNPRPSVQWRKHEGKIGVGTKISGNTLLIGDAQDSDRGYYVCDGVLGATVVAQKYVYVDIENVDTSTQGNPTVTVSQRTISIPRGGRGAVECKPEGNPLPRVQWTKSDGELRSGISPNGNTLVISDAREEDYGDYVCQGIVDGSVMGTDYLRVVIENVDPRAQSNLKVTVSQRTLGIPLGGRGSIECTPEGNPLPRIQWIKSDGQFRDGISQSGNTLIISDARMEDRGHYVCQGIVDGTVMLTNYSAVEIERRSLPPVTPQTPPPPVNPKVTVSERQMRIPLGGRASIKCTPEGNPLPRVRWIKANGEFRNGTGPSGNTLIISDARMEDRGHYACQGILDGTVMVIDYSAVDVESNEGRSLPPVTPQTPPPPVNPKVTVSERQMRIPLGGRASIKCTPEGNPLPRVRWIKANGEFRNGTGPSGNTLIISDARMEDRGHYACQGIVDGTVMVTDYSAVDVESNEGRSLPPVTPQTPPPPVNPKVTVSERQMRIPLGGRASIKCTPEGNPLPRVRWIKANGEFRNGTGPSGNTLIISDARMEDRGHYACQGIVDGTVMVTDYSAVDVESNEGRSLPPVTPQTPPPPVNPKVTVSERQMRIPLGGRASIKCTPEGNPLPRVRWIKANGEFRNGTGPSGNTLIISDARMEDRGHYACQGIVDGTVMVTDYSAVDVESNEGRSLPPVTPQTPPPSVNPKVTVSERQMRIPLGGRASIKCTPEGNPLPRVRWIKANGEFRNGTGPSGNTLIISDARMEDRGHYACQGIVDGTVMVIDYSAVDVESNEGRSLPPVTPQTPPPPVNPKVTVSERQIRIPLGGRASIKCTPEGNPLPRVRWIKANGEFRNGTGASGNTLIISDARMEDRGHYACQGIVDGTVMVTDYSAVDVESNEGRPDHSDQLPKPIDVVISEGSLARIICDFETGDHEQKVTWTRRDQRRLPQNTQIGQELVIQSATKEDSGEYLCKVTASRGGFLLRVAYVRLEVLALPLVSVRPPAQTVARGEAVTVECVVDGDAQVTWDRVEGSLSSRVENQGSKLYIKGIEVEDAGYYRCSAQNRAGISSGIAQVIVNDVEPPAEYLQLIVSQRQVIIPKGGSGSIECTPKGNPLPRVQWTKSNGEFRDGIRQSGNTLIISDARMEDRGHYACQGIVDGTVMLTNYSAVDVRDEPQPAPPANLRSPSVVVSQKQLTVTPGERVSIDCTPEGSPLPRVQWIKSNGDFRDGVRQDGNTLVIDDAREEDEAHYVCQAVVDGTVIGTDFADIIIENEPQTSPPAYLRSPNVVVSQRQLTATPGESVSIDCTPEGNPLPKIQWIKSNGKFRDGVRQNGTALIISEARKEDEAHYVCQGIVDGTVMVTDFSAVHIESDEWPPVVAGNSRVQVEVRKLKIPKGGSRTVKCIPEGNPLPTIQWSKHEGEFGAGTRQSGNALIISNAQEQDGGYYVCDGMVDGTAAWVDYLAVEIESNETSQSLSYPRVTVNVRQLRIPRGGTIAIECTPEGSPLPTIQWSKEGGNFGIGTRQRGNSLEINDAQEEDRGNYVCSAVVDGSPVFSDYLTVEIQYNCELPKETGSCRAAFDRWYYDSTQHKCQKFTWGGCGGNKNNFETEEQCSLECERMRPNDA